MKKNRLLVFILLMAVIEGVAQPSYISTDSTISSGVKILEGTVRDNCRAIRAKLSGGGVVTYSPVDINEYGLKGGIVYVSRTISVNGVDRQVFLKRLVQGNTSLYYYASDDFRAYFLEKADGILVAFSKEQNQDYKEVLSQNLGGCTYTPEQIKLVRYTPSLLSRLVSNYNKCSSRPFPYFKFGMQLGYGVTGLSATQGNGEILRGNSINSHKGFSAGIFADNPIGGTDFSVNTGIYLSRNGYSSSSSSQNVDTDIVINFTSLDVPILVRYTVPTLTWRPYVNAGGIFSCHFNNTGAIYQATENQNVVTINQLNTQNLVDDFGYGFSVGGGIQRNLNLRNTISFELRYSKMYSNPYFLNKDQLMIFMGFSF